ncbi:MAG: hypothetical protein QGG42_03105 [Phycisphaerae bacterium]|nr:hypothetical protein [Phycisphaerae bacterium]
MKKNWFVRLLRTLICLCVLGVILVWVAKIWILPPLVRSVARSYLDDVWFGTVEIDSVEVNLFSPSYVRGVRVRDELGRAWLNVPNIRIDTAWDGFIPRLEGVRVAVAAISPQFVDGKCTIPLKKILSDRLDIAKILNDFKAVKLTVDVASLCTVNTASPAEHASRGIVVPDALAAGTSRTNIVFQSIKWEDGTFSAARSLGEIGDDRISINMSGGLEPDGSALFRGDGLLLTPDQAVEGKIEVLLKRGGRRLFEIHLDGAVQADISCEVQADGTTHAILDILASNIKPDEFEWLIGSNELAWLAIESSDAKVHLKATDKPNMPLAAAGEIELSGPIGRIKAKIEAQYDPDDTSRLTAKVTGSPCHGNLHAEVTAVHRRNESTEISLSASAHQINMASLTRILTPDRIMERGIGAGEIRMAMSAENLATIKGRGAFFLDDADLWQVPILSALFRHMNLRLDKADIQSVFSLKGTTTTIETGQLATLVWAADFEKGGTVDHSNGKVDMYVLFLPIKQAGILLNIVKAINPLRLVAKEVFRLHVTGSTDDPKITPVPFSDLSKLPAGALGLLKDVAASGGQLGGDIFKAILNGGD